MNKGLKNVLIIILCCTVSATAAVGLYDYYRIGRLERKASSTPTNIETTFDQPRMTRAVFSSNTAPDDFADVAAKTINGVVNIRSEVARSQQEMQSFPFDPFEFFFGPLTNRGQGQPQTRELPPKIGIGSGVIISTDGYIITNNHVVENATKLIVNTNDNREYEATVIGSDPMTDIALIKINATGLTPIPFGNSEALRVGEWVLAIGNPFNLSSTVTAGIVSAKGRSTLSSGAMEIASFIQTDAAVNPGNSGGALVNTRGELVGINTMIYSQTGNYAGYSFAVPVSIAAKVVEDIKKYGTVQRAMLGVTGGPISSEVTEKYGLKVSQGAVVVGFADQSAAKKAGIKEGDVITSVNGVKIRNMAELQEQISKYRPGDKISLTINRKGDEKTINNIELTNNHGSTDLVSGASPSALGAEFKELSNQQRSRMGLDHGVEVSQISAGKFRSAGIGKGFIILSINNVAVHTPAEIESIVKHVVNNEQEKVLLIKAMQPSGRIGYYVVDLN